MKLTKQKLKEIIREEIQKLNEGLLWEQGLDEGWFSDLKAKAQQAYIKANPGSKYAKGVKSGDKEAPMTGAGEGEPADVDSGGSSGGSGGDFPGDDTAGGGGGDDLTDMGGDITGADDAGGADLTGEPVDFEEPAEEPEA